MRTVEISIIFQCEDSVSDDVIQDFVCKLENEVAKDNYDLDDITHEIEGEYIPEETCEHDWRFVKGNEDVSMYRCRLCRAETLN